MADESKSESLPALSTKPVLDAQIISPPVPLAEMSDADLGREAALAVDRALTLRENSAEQARRAGELLLEGKHRCREQGISWRYWLQKHWTKSRATADAYILIATEVQSDLAGAPGQKEKDLLACQSIRKFLTDRGYGAGGTRDEVDEEDKAERAAIEAEAIERATAPDPTPERRNNRPPASAPARGGLSSSLTPEEQARRADAEAMARRERLAIEEAEKRDTLHNPPTAEEAKRVGRPKPPPVLEEGEEVPCFAVELGDLHDRFVDAHHRLAMALTDLNKASDGLWPFDGNEREALIHGVQSAAGPVVAAAASLAKKWAPDLKKAAAVEARLVGEERERRAKAARKNRKGA